MRKSTQRNSMGVVLLALVGLPLLFAACNYKSSNGASDGGNTIQSTPGGAQPSFVQLSSQVLNQKCFTCHNGTRQIDLTSYGTFHSDIAEIRSLIAAKKMPPAGNPQLTDQELSSVLSWIDSGAPESGSSAGAPPSTATNAAMTVPVPSFDSMKSDFLAAKCISCHAHAAGGRHDLSDYAHFQKLAGSVQTRVLTPLGKKGHMPEDDHPQLTDEELTTLVTWISEGAPEAGFEANLLPPNAPPASASPVPAPPLPTPLPPIATPTPVPSATPLPSTPTPAPSATPSGPAVLGFEDLKAAVLNAKCMTCHDGSDIADDADDLRTYQAFAAKAQKVKSRILAPLTSDSHMPPTDQPKYPQLTQNEISMIVAWVDAGAPQIAPK